MSDFTTLQTERFDLRRPTLNDVAAVERIASQFAVADGVLTIPHPYPEGEAERTIQRWIGMYEAGTAIGFLVRPRGSDEVIGNVGLGLTPEHRRAHLGYVVDPKWWGRGVATEAVRAAVGCVFETTDTVRVEAGHFPQNPASGRVLEKLGFTCEGTLRSYYARFGEMRDTRMFSLLRAEWERLRREGEATQESCVAPAPTGARPTE